MSHRGRLAAALARGGFRRLMTVRMAGQFGDGMFQASLAGAVLFDPTHQARAADVAAGFAVLLLPYSLVGPFTGVLLDRWWRQRVLALANVVRAAGVVGIGALIASDVHGQVFYASALLVLSVNRFVLSALSASLPHVVHPGELVSVNSFSTTLGALSTATGGATALLLRIPFGSGDAGYAVIAVLAAVPYLLAMLAARGFYRQELGPDHVERGKRETIADIARGLAGGARHVVARRPVLFALGAIGAHRFCYGITTVSMLLLYRNYFHDEGFFRAGIGGLAQLVIAVAVGSGLAAWVTPAASRRMGLARWPVVLLAVTAVVEIGLGLPFRMPLLLVAGVAFGFCAQGIKICVDTIVQRSVDDDFRGRVFSLYDTLFNVTFVAAATVTALTLPETGHSPTAVVVLGVGYAIIAAVYLRVGRGPVDEQAPVPDLLPPEPAEPATGPRAGR